MFTICPTLCRWCTILTTALGCIIFTTLYTGNLLIETLSIYSHTYITKVIQTCTQSCVIPKTVHALPTVLNHQTV